MNDIPRVAHPAPESEWWPVKFQDGVSTIFTAKLRHLSSNQKHPVIQAGYAGMVKAAQIMGRLAQDSHVKLVFTVIPTKGLAYAEKVRQEKLAPPDDYNRLIQDEGENIAWLRQELEKIPDAVFVDVVRPLQEAAIRATPLYPKDINGHPIEAGYDVIGRTLAEKIQPLLSEPIDGLVEIRRDREPSRVYLIRGGKAWLVSSNDILIRNGWRLRNIRPINGEKLMRFELAGNMDKVDPVRFGPR